VASAETGFRALEKPAGAWYSAPGWSSEDWRIQTGGERMESVSSSEERTWAMVTHLSALAGYAIPFGHVFGPLLVWILKKETLPAVEEHGKEALNFQISCTIYAAVAFVLVFVAIGLALLLAVAIFDLVFIIIAAVKAYNGESYRYPLSIRFIK
jgi:uncharacterized Tic20 family protein